MFWSIFFLTISAFCFITVNVLSRSQNRLYATISFISGFILPVIPEYFIFNIKWYWLLLINFAILMFFSEQIAIFVLRRIASGRSLKADLITSSVIAFVTLGIGLLIKYL